MNQQEVISLMTRSLKPIRQELNELDWKNGISPQKKRLVQHLSAFANYSGGGFIVLGIDDASGIPRDVSDSEANSFLQLLTNLASEALEPRVQLDGFSFSYDAKTLFAVFIYESEEKPVHLRKQSVEDSFIRSGGTTRKMDKNDIRQAFLRSHLKRWEELSCVIPYDIDNFDSILDFSQVFRRIGISNFTSIETRNTWLISHKLLKKERNALLPTHLGVLTCCKSFTMLSAFNHCNIRVLKIDGETKISPAREKIFNLGYSLSLDEIEKYIIDNIPHTEIINQATRIDIPAMPALAIRELLGNAVIHRDYSITLGQITVEIFSNRIEVTSPGGLLPGVSVDRLIDHPSRTRNEVLADFMKQLNFFEERGSGFDKVVNSLEELGLPPVEVRTGTDFFTAVLRHSIKFDEMSKEVRIEAAFQHACLNFVSGKKTTNSTLRERFKLANTSSKLTQIFRLLSDAVAAGRLKVRDPHLGPKQTDYVPYWA